MDRTESQLCEKLRQNGYPEECVAAAVEYVKQYHYIDDLRYAKQYIRYHQQKKSSQRLKMDLMKKRVGREQIEQALAEEFVSDERAQIAELFREAALRCGAGRPQGTAADVSVPHEARF